MSKHTPTVDLTVRHTKSCVYDCCPSHVGIAPESGASHDAPWFAFYTHDIGEGGADFQVLYEGKNRAEVEAAIAKAEGQP